MRYLVAAMTLPTLSRSSNSNTKVRSMHNAWSHLFVSVFAFSLGRFLAQVRFPSPSATAKVSPSLASEQSVGFFHDIPDDDWQRRRVRAYQEANRPYKKPLKDMDGPGPEFWYLNHAYPDFSCPNTIRVGGVGDGPKWVCDPHRIGQVAKARGQTSQRGGCLVYSVGCNGQYEFEDALLEILGECEIHIFDFSGDFARPNDVERHNIHFHKWALISSYDDRFHPNTNEPRYTLAEIRQKLNHQGRYIDILKADCEMCEWGSYQDWLRDGQIGQVLVELHNIPKVDDPMSFFHDFRDAGFAIYSKEANIHPWARLDMTHEYGFIKLDRAFFDMKDPVVSRGIDSRG